VDVLIIALLVVRELVDRDVKEKRRFITEKVSQRYNEKAIFKRRIKRLFKNAGI